MRHWLPALAVVGILLLGAVAGVGAQPDDGAERPFLGVQLNNTDSGVAIVDILAQSPAAEADLQIDDLIVAVNGEPVETARAVANAIRVLAPGDTMTLDLLRGEEPLSVEVVLGSQPDRPGRILLDMGITYNADEFTWTIERLSEDSPLSEAGLREGDVIVEINDEPRDPAGVMSLLRDLDNSTSFMLAVEREGETLQIEVGSAALRTLFVGSMTTIFEGELPFGDLMPFPHGGMRGMEGMPFGLGAQNGRLGVAFQPLTAELAAELGLDVTEGALIREVQADSPAAEAGLQADDIVTAVNGEPVDAERTLRDRLFAYEPGDVVTLDVLRAGEALQIEATLGEPLPGIMMGRFGPGRDGRGLRGQVPFDQPEPVLPQSEGAST
jgi:S1-C subfamily serine protease